MFTRAERPAATFHHSLLLADRVLLLLGMRVHFVVLLVLPKRVHLVVLLLVLLVRIHLVVLLLMRLQFVAGGVGQHRLEQVGRLTGLVGGRVHEGGGSLGMLLLDFRRFPRIRNLSALLRLLLELHLGVGRDLRVRGNKLTM